MNASNSERVWTLERPNSVYRSCFLIDDNSAWHEISVKLDEKVCLFSQEKKSSLVFVCHTTFLAPYGYVMVPAQG
jgi:hypothetical protein